MRPLTRVLLRRPIRPYPTHISGSIARFHTRQPLLLASEKVGITARIRQKLWGTSEPPGPADPYSKAEGGAAAVEEPVDMAGYEPAEDGRGLPIMGLEEQFGVWEVDSFLPKSKIVDTEAVQRALHRAVVESVVLQLNGRDLESAFGFYTPKDAESITDNVQLSVREDGSIQVAFPEAGAEEAILASLEEVVPAAAEEAEAISTEDVEAAGIPPVDTAEAETIATEPAAAESTVETAETEVSEVVAESTPPGPAPAYLTNPTHHALPLPSPSFTFAVSKRVLQLTGHQIPDAVLTRAKSVGDLLPSLITPPKPKKLSEELEPLLEELPNVRLFEKKRVGLDKEMELGRARKVDAKEVYRYKGIDPERGYIGEKPYAGDVNKNFY